MLYFFLFFIWIMLLFRVFADIFRSHDMGGFAKALWVIFVIVLPFLGVFVYLIARGDKSWPKRDVATSPGAAGRADQGVRAGGGRHERWRRRRAREARRPQGPRRPHPGRVRRTEGQSARLSMPDIEKVVRAVDRLQQRYGPTAFVFAVFKKFGDDGCGNIAALITYYGFVSLFPLLLVAVTVLGFVLEGNEDLQHQLVDSALANFPIIGDQIQANVGKVQGSGVGLTIGIVLTLYGGLGIANVAQHAMNRIWGVPMFATRILPPDLAQPGGARHDRSGCRGDNRAERNRRPESLRPRRCESRSTWSRSSCTSACSRSRSRCSSGST